MSAIWGAISLNGKPLPQGLSSIMKTSYSECVIDKFREYEDDFTMLGCGVQFVTPEAQLEILPIAEKESEIYFTADIMLDNRQELLTKLNLEQDSNIIPDGTIAFEMLKRYGENCLNDLLGAYSFVYYDKKQNSVIIVLDSTGNRCLYYTIKNEILYFSSLIISIIDAVGNEGINELWITDFLAIDNLATMSQFEETAYKNIYRVSPRQIINIKDATVHKRLYWNPEIKQLNLSSDTEYASQLKEIYSKSIACLLRCEKPSLLLSGGLDSTSIASYAARQLAKQNKTLYTYTSVPEAGYVSDKSSYYVVDESDAVLKTKKYLEDQGCNIVCNFLDLPNKNGWDSRTSQMKSIETPYKSLQNLLWIYESMQKAYAEGSRILMNGSFGNCTISALGIDNYLNDLLYKRKYITYIKQYRMFCATFAYGKKQQVKLLLKSIKEYATDPKPKYDDATLFKGSYVNKNIAEKYNTKQNLIKLEQSMKPSKKDYNKNQSTIIHDLLFSQYGEINTKYSLATGIMPRDPTLDKRLIEFCIQLSPDQFAKNGVGKRLVLEYMKNDMPPHSLHVAQYGVQSADMVLRFSKHWQRIYSEILNIYKSNLNSSIVDSKKAIEDCEKINNSIESAESFDLLRICYTAMCLEFINKNKV